MHAPVGPSQAGLTGGARPGKNLLGPPDQSAGMIDSGQVPGDAPVSGTNGMGIGGNKYGARKPRMMPPRSRVEKCGPKACSRWPTSCARTSAVTRRINGSVRTHRIISRCRRIDLKWGRDATVSDGSTESGGSRVASATW